MAERVLQQKVIQVCNKHRLVAVKVDSTSTRGWPDLTVLRPDGEVFFIELKTDKGKLSKIQKHVHSKIKQNKGNVHTVRSVDEFESLVIDPRTARSCR